MPFHGYFLLVFLVTLNVVGAVSVYRINRKSDREFGKGWRKRRREEENKPIN